MWLNISSTAHYRGAGGDYSCRQGHEQTFQGFTGSNFEKGVSVILLNGVGRLSPWLLPCCLIWYRSLRIKGIRDCVCILFSVVLIFAGVWIGFYSLSLLSRSHHNHRILNNRHQKIQQSIFCVVGILKNKFHQPSLNNLGECI